jgi:hypothetical protein
LLGIAAHLVRRRRRSLARLARALFNLASHLRLSAPRDPSEILLAWIRLLRSYPRRSAPFFYLPRSRN